MILGEKNNEQLVEFITAVLPAPLEIKEIDATSKERCISFHWMGYSFQVAYNMVVYEIVDERVANTTRSILMEHLLKVAHEQGPIQVVQKAPLDPNEKQWKIECEVLETERLKAQAAADSAKAEVITAEAMLVNAEAAKKDAEARLVECGGTVNKTGLRVTCGYCSGVFEYDGKVDGTISEMHERFLEEHHDCGRE